MRIILGASLVVALAACSSGSSSDAHDSMMDGESMMDGGMHHHGANSKQFENARTIDIAARSFAFTPKSITVAAGERVNIHLTSKDVLHDFTVEGQDVHVVAKAGKSATGGMRLSKAGKYTFSCTVSGHRAAGMRGTITVTAP